MYYNDPTHPYVWHDSFICVTWLTPQCGFAMTHSPSYVWIHWFTCVTWLTHTCDMTLFIGLPCHCALQLPHAYMWHDLFNHVRHDSLHRVGRPCHRALHLPHAYVWRDSFIHVWHDSLHRIGRPGKHFPPSSCMCVTWLVHVCDMTRSHVWHDSLHRPCHGTLHLFFPTSCMCVTWLIQMCDMTHSYVWHDAFMYVTWLIHICNMTHSVGRPCHRALHLPLRRRAWHHGLKFSKVSLC